MKILIIEDEKDLSNDIVEYLSMDIYKCEQAFNYHEALDKICLYCYDCILLDLNLPGGEGLKILDEIKKQDMKTGIIIISARGEVNDRVLGIQTGADDYLVKPISLSELSVRIYALMIRF